MRNVKLLRSGLLFVICVALAAVIGHRPVGAQAGGWQAESRVWPEHTLQPASNNPITAGVAGGFVAVIKVETIDGCDSMSLRLHAPGYPNLTYGGQPLDAEGLEL